MTYDYRYGCDCTLISRNGEKINKPYPIPVTDVMVYLVELLDLTNLAYDAIETETDPYLQHYSFVFNFTENLFTVLLDYSYVGIGQELNPQVPPAWNTASVVIMLIVSADFTPT